LWFPYVTLRSQRSSASIATVIRHELDSIDPRLPLMKIRTMDEVLAGAQARPRFITLLLTMFTAVALVLAAVGVYGVVSYVVALRTREFGIRLALGAQRRAVFGQVLGRGLLLIGWGVVVGLAGACGLTRFLTPFLFGITPTDPTTFVAVALLLGSVALFATYLPARRATKVDPLIALRVE
jgi:putative ABC transport system permease protein